MATGTIIAAEKVQDYIEIPLNLDGGDPGVACSFGAPFAHYIPAGQSFATTNVIWLNDDGTGVPLAGFYSNGTISRQWNGVDTLAAPVNCPPEQIELSFGLDEVNLCTAPQSAMYVESNATFADASLLRTDFAFSINADPGYYSDGIIYRVWNGFNFTGVNEPCPLVPVLIHSGVDDLTACASGPDVTHYVEAGATFLTATELWFDPAGTIPPAATWWSDGVHAREWDGNAFIGFETICP